MRKKICSIKVITLSYFTASLKRYLFTVSVETFLYSRDYVQKSLKAALT